MHNIVQWLDETAEVYSVDCLVYTTDWFNTIIELSEL
jgi:hypothetical protein